LLYDWFLTLLLLLLLACSTYSTLISAGKGGRSRMDQVGCLPMHAAHDRWGFCLAAKAQTSSA
jgi:hypothetical protein